VAIALKYAHLCDYAGIGANGKAIAVGIFEWWMVPAGAPTILPLCYFVARLEASFADGTDHTGAIVIRDADAKEVWRLPIPQLRLVPVGPGRPLAATLFALLTNVGVPGLGDYVIEVVVDDKAVGETDFSFIEAPPA
jgi:hypothetical protein